MTQEDGGPAYSTSTAASPTTNTTEIPHSDRDGHESDLSPLSNNDGPSLTNTLAAATIAVLACVLIITLALIIRALHRRRVRQRGQELNIIPTISAGIISANVNAYGGHHNAAQPDVTAYGGHNTPRPDGAVSWESVTPSTSTPEVVLPSSSASPS